jgi:hypothetical protein
MLEERINVLGVEIVRYGNGQIAFKDCQEVEVRADSNDALTRLFDRLKQAGA